MRHYWHRVTESEEISRMYDMFHSLAVSCNNGNFDRRDCYIYILSPLSLSVGGRLKIFDADDRELDLTKYSNRSQLPAASYPEDSYFPIKVRTFTDGTSLNEIDESHISSSYSTLRKSVIIPGLPKFDSISELRGTVKDNYSLAAIGNFLREDSIDTIVGRFMRDVLYDWPISDGDDPLTVGDLRGILDGVTEMGDIFRDIANSGLMIDKGTGRVYLKPSDIEGIMDRIWNRRVFYKGGYSVSQSDFPYIGDNVLSDMSRFPSVLRSRIFYDSSTGQGIHMESYIDSDNPHSRPSLVSIRDRLSVLSGDSTDPDMESLCTYLDDIMGNDSTYILKIGDEDEESLCDPASENMADRYQDLMIDTIVDTANQFLDYRYRDAQRKALSDLRYRYSTIYTSESVSDNVNVINGKPVVGDSLQIDYMADTTYRILEQIRMDGSSGAPVHKEMTTGKWIETFLSNPRSLQRRIYRGSILKELRERLSSYTSEYLQDYEDAISGSNLFMDRAKVLEYLEGDSSGALPCRNSAMDTSSDSTYRFILSIPSLSIRDGEPVLSPIDTESVSSRLREGTEPSDDSVWAVNSVGRVEDRPDVSYSTLMGVAEYISMALDGPQEGGTVPVKYVGGEDDELKGNTMSLYYKRYQMLNNRMNRLQGPLWKAASYMRNSRIYDDMRYFSTQLLDSYSKFITIIPIASMEPLTYMPSQKATMSTVSLDGKFYSSAELEAMRASINSKCVLTCTSCSIKDTCPFYDENEVIKMYCTGIETLDIYVKDNELDLLVDDSISITSPEGEGFDMDRYRALHRPYSDILKKVGPEGSVTYEVNDLNKVREQLRNEENLEYSKYVKDDMGWILHGRYGTVEKNPMKDLIANNRNSDYYSVADSIHPYRYLYNALFIADEESYVEYAPSSRRYNVSFEMGRPGDRKLYTGSTKVKIPVSLKIIRNASDDDDVYLISDDTKDPDGKDIIPVIYLGKVHNLQWTFDMVDDGVGDDSADTEIMGSQSPDDPRIYASDVAQWCINYYKGNCAEYPIGSDSVGGMADNYTNRDQYWMDKVYKKILDPETGTYRWCEYDGRKRMSSGYSEPLMDEASFDDVTAVSGRPVIADYVNFVRKMSIRMYDNEREENKWTIPWVNPDLPSLNGVKMDAEVQRSVLPLMKTNLRLAVVKSGKY